MSDQTLIYCSVSFDGGKTYYYLTDDDTIEIGDEVVVPVGNDGNELTGMVEDIEYFSPENVPFPLDKVKSIICKADDDWDEGDDDWNDEDEPEDETQWDKTKTELYLGDEDSEATFSVSGLGNGDRYNLNSCWCLVNLRVKNKFFSYELREDEAFDFGEMVSLRSKLGKLLSGKLNSPYCTDFMEPTLDFELNPPCYSRLIINLSGTNGQSYVIPLYSENTKALYLYLNYCIKKIRKETLAVPDNEYATNPICPRCGSKITSRILYGMPAMNEELQRQLDTKEVVLGGCCITDCDPAYHCNSCKKDFGYKAAELEAATTKVYFSVGGFHSGNETVTVTKTPEGALLEASVLILNYGELSVSKNISEERWLNLISDLHRGCFISDWKKRHIDAGILDGDQWEFEIHYTDRKPLKIVGSNKYPPYWDKFKRIIDNIGEDAQ